MQADIRKWFIKPGGHGKEDAAKKQSSVVKPEPGDESKPTSKATRKPKPVETAPKSKPTESILEPKVVPAPKDVKPPTALAVTGGGIKRPIKSEDDVKPSTGMAVTGGGMKRPIKSEDDVKPSAAMAVMGGGIKRPIKSEDDGLSNVKAEDGPSPSKKPRVLPDDAGRVGAKDGGRKSAPAGRGAGRGRGSADGSEAQKPSGGGRGRGGWAGGWGEKAQPPHKGEKEVPRGAENALAGLTFVISGTLDSLEREEAEDLIKSHGGRVTGSVSKKTSYLLADEDVGGRKSQTAKDLGVPFMKEDDLFEMIRKSSKGGSAGSVSQATPVPKPPPAKAAPLAKPLNPAPAASTKAGVPRNVGEVSKQADRKGKALASSSSSANRPEDTEADSWVHKYAPISLNDVVGNAGLVHQLKGWLSTWESKYGHVDPKQKGKKGAGSSGAKLNEKAIMLSGGPGIGKTTAAKLVCKELGYATMEVNASDSRGKSDSSVSGGVAGKTSNTIKEMVDNMSLSFSGERHQRPVLIMDEVDGMSGGDRGGVADLIASIKVSRVPVICICNDFYSQKLKSLQNYCLQLKFRKPTKQQMAKRLDVVAKTEGLQVQMGTLEELAERVNGDMRMAINQLQYMALSSKAVSYDDMKTRLNASKKDEEISPFAAVDRLMGYDGGRMKLSERFDQAMVDMDLIPLIVQENYLNFRPDRAGRDDEGTQRMDLAARAATSIADADIVNVQIRRYQRWQHAPFAAFSATVFPAACMHGRREVFAPGERNFNRFGGWFGKNSTAGKNQRLLGELHEHVLASRVCEPPRSALRLDYFPVLCDRLTTPLKAARKEDVREVLGLMEEYSLTQEDYDTVIELSKFKGREPLQGVTPAVKSQLTREYKAGAQDRRVKSADLLPAVFAVGQKKAPPKKKKARGPQMEFTAADVDEESGAPIGGGVEGELGEDEDVEGEAAEENDEEGEGAAKENGELFGFGSVNARGITVELSGAAAERAGLTTGVANAKKRGPAAGRGGASSSGSKGPSQSAAQKRAKK